MRRHVLAVVAAIGLFVAQSAHAQWITGFQSANGSTAFTCPQGTALPDGCTAGLSYQQSNFFSGGYANQSFGQVLSGITNLQPAVYPVRPPWNVGGVDYPVGIPAAKAIAALKDPANIANDALANPDGVGADCTFAPDTSNHTTFPIFAPNNGAMVLCTKSGSPKAIVLDGYNFGGYNFSTTPVYGCVALVIKDNAWPSVTITDNVFTNGTNCNTWQGSGASSAANAYQIENVSGATSYPVIFENNTLYGCGPDNQGAIEAAQCLLNFPGTSGQAPFDNHFWADSSPGNRTIWYNAWIHAAGRDIQGNDNGGGFTDDIRFNYVEGFIYIHGGSGEHGEFKEYGTKTNGSQVVNSLFNVCLQTSFVDAGPGEGSDSCLYYSAGSNGGNGTVSVITAAGTTATATFGLSSGTSLIVGDTLVISGGTNPDFDGTWTVATKPTGSTVTFAFPGTSGGNCTSVCGATYVGTHHITFTGTQGYNVFITNLNPAHSPFWTTQSAAASFAYSDFGITQVGPNYIDPTGSLYCYSQISSPSFSGLTTFAANVNLLGTAADPLNASVNQFNTIYASAGGTYNSGTGLVTLTAASPPSFTTGASIFTGNATGTGSFGNINGTHTVTVSGNSVSYTIGTGLTMTITSAQFTGTPLHCVGSQG